MHLSLPSGEAIGLSDVLFNKLSSYDNNNHLFYFAPHQQSYELLAVVQINKLNKTHINMLLILVLNNNLKR